MTERFKRSEDLPPEDVQELNRRLREEYDLITCGFDPADDAERDPWIKCHAGDVMSRELALEEIARGRA